jgi:tRNA1Val (adenine37-N6)-methyltransferase
MANTHFQFKYFTVNQQGAAMKVGTDGVLLGAWTPVANCSRIVDIGTGTGLLALMCAQRNALATIDAVEIDASAAVQAKANFDLSPWGNRLTVHHADVCEFANRAIEKYDLAICNPPFFVGSLHAPDKSRTTARHDLYLPLTDLSVAVVKLLTHNGRFAVVLPPEQLGALVLIMKDIGFYPSNCLNIHPTPTKPVKRVLALFVRGDGATLAEDLIVETNGRHVYSEDYKLLTKGFYLAF